jgi:hypothetical protein
MPGWPILIFTLLSGPMPPQQPTVDSTVIARDLHVARLAEVPIKLQAHAAGEALSVRLRSLKTANPPGVIFEISLRCLYPKYSKTLGYVNFFSATREGNKRLEFTFDLPSKRDFPCSETQTFLAIRPNGDIAPESDPQIGVVEVVRIINSRPED